MSASVTVDGGGSGSGLLFGRLISSTHSKCSLWVNSGEVQALRDYAKLKKIQKNKITMEADGWVQVLF